MLFLPYFLPFLYENYYLMKCLIDEHIKKSYKKLIFLTAYMVF